jgi:lipopolysaccharide transport system permease protein
MNHMAEKTTIYLPDNSIRKGYIALFREMVEELTSSRWLTWQLFKRDFSALYKQSLLGVFWALFVPLISVGTFIYLNRAGIFDIGDISVPYPLFAVAGMAFWQLFATGLISSTNSLVNAGAMLTKINFTREALVISATGQAIVSFLIQIAVVFVLFLWYQIIPSWTLVLVPFAMLPLFLFTLGLGFIFSVINGVLRDVGNMISVSITFLLFLTPVLYAKPESGIAAVVSNYNPLYYLISVPRDLLILGGTTNLYGYMWSALLAIVVFFVCWTAFHLTETRITERI